ncbi:hypothetical protein C5C67_14515, partial [Rathayibacter sp. AY1E1]
TELDVPAGITGATGIAVGFNHACAIWLHPSHTLRPTYAGGRMPRINPAWISALTDLANSASGLRFVPEPPEPVHPPGGSARR